MKKTYYLFNPGRMSRQQNTLKFVAQDQAGNLGKARFVPIEGIESLYIFGSIDSNSALFNFLGRKHVPVHFFDYYEHYTGSFQPKDYLLAGKSQIAQTKTFLNKQKRLYIAQQLIKAASHNMLHNVKYYNRRGKKLQNQILSIEALQPAIDKVNSVSELMGVEGNIRQVYYSGFEEIITHFSMNGRHRNPPSNEVNALISFGNMMCYTLALDMLYHTQLNPTISFLHEPGYRRYSLALDLAEVFKPILVDRCIFSLLNRRVLQVKHFDKEINGCYLNDTGRQLFIQAFEERLKQTIKHPTLGRSVSHKRLVLLECYKLMKYVLDINPHFRTYKTH
jgi:CRISPR-associated protein Cas1